MSEATHLTKTSCEEIAKEVLSPFLLFISSQIPTTVGPILKSNSDKCTIFIERQREAEKKRRKDMNDEKKKKEAIAIRQRFLEGEEEKRKANAALEEAGVVKRVRLAPGSAAETAATQPAGPRLAATVSCLHALRVTDLVRLTRLLGALKSDWAVKAKSRQDRT